MSVSKIKATVFSQEQLASDVFSMWLEVGSIASEAKPGQFISVYSNDDSKLLPRPISICEIDREKGRLRIVYRVVGYGTKEFSGCKAGDTLEIMGPLGNGYTLKKDKAILVAGGIGVPPMLELAKELDCEKTIVLGYRDELFLNKEFEQYGKVVIATEDGSSGTKGNVLNAIQEKALEADVIFACGPTPMLRALKEYAAANNITCWISMEERMACGIGACLACVCQSKEKDHHSNVNNKRICKDGPVFLAEEVEL